MTYETLDELYEAKRDQALKSLMDAQEMGEGVTPGVLRNRLKMEEHDFLNLIKGLKDEGIIDILPPDRNQKRGRRSPIIHATKLLKYHDDPIQMIMSDGTPVVTDDDNPFYLIDKSRRGNKQAAALGTSAVTCIVDEMLTFAGRQFTINQLKSSLEASVKVPEHIVDFVWHRFTHDLYEESNYNGGWDIIASPDAIKLKRRDYLSPEEIESKQHNTLQEAVAKAYLKDIGSPTNKYIFFDHHGEETRQKFRNHVEHMATAGTAPAVIEHPHLKTWHGKRNARTAHMEGFGDKWPDIVGVDDGAFAVVRDIFGCPDEEHRMNLITLAQVELTLLEALNAYEESHGHEASQE